MEKKRYRLIHFRNPVEESAYVKLGTVYISGKKYIIYKGHHTERMFLKDPTKPKGKGWSQLVNEKNLYFGLVK
jgi:hypothetical protein